jgi:hypothetical protein
VTAVYDRAVVVFLGPSLSVDVARRVLPAEYRPPAAQGDVLTAALAVPSAIGLIDGVFDRQPAVWHKEILWAMSRGILVYGAASVGALRAAELDEFGMRGEGEVYRAFREGKLEDDDEVAVAHAGREDGYRSLSQSMVEIRATLKRAMREGVIGSKTGRALERRMKETFYAERQLRSVLDTSNDEHERLRGFLKQGWVHVKRTDAVAMLERIGADLCQGLKPKLPSWDFQHTVFWDEAYQAGVASFATANDEGAMDASVDVDPADHDAIGHVLDEARLDPLGYETLWHRALADVLALSESQRFGPDRAAWSTNAFVEQLRRSEGLFGADQLEAWLAKRTLDRDDLDGGGWRAAALERAARRYRRSIEEEVLFILRSSGALAALAKRAANKERALGGHRRLTAVPDDESLIRWYFTERLHREPPAMPQFWARAHGWLDVGDLLSALRREWSYIEQRETEGL